MKELVADLQVDPSADFADIASRLLDYVGQTSTQAGQAYHDLKARDLKSKSVAKSLQKIQRLLHRTTKGAKHKDEALSRLTIAKVRSLLPPKGRQYLDSQKSLIFLTCVMYSNHGNQLKEFYLEMMLPYNQNGHREYLLGGSATDVDEWNTKQQSATL